MKAQIISALLVVLLALALPVAAEEPASGAAIAAAPRGGRVVVGEDTGGKLSFIEFPGLTGDLKRTLQPFGPTFGGGVGVAAGDVNGDGRADIVASQLGATAPEVRLFDGASGAQLAALTPYTPTGIIAVLIGLLSGPNDPTTRLVTVPAEGAAGPVKVMSILPFIEQGAFMPYPGQDVKGLRVASGDVTGDGRADIIVAPAPGAALPVRVFDGTTNAPVRSFFPFGPTYRGGISVAVGDFDGDGKADLATSVESGAPFVRVFLHGDPDRPVTSFIAAPNTVDSNETITIHGATVAAGDLDGDGRDEIIVGSVGGSPWVLGYTCNRGCTNPIEIFSLNLFADGSVRMASQSRWTDVVFPAVADVNGDGRADVVVGLTKQGTGTLLVLEVNRRSQTITPYGPSFTGGVRVAAGDVTGDGIADVVTGAGVGGGPHVKVFDGRTRSEIGSFFAFDQGFLGGIHVGVGDFDGDGRGDIVASRGPGGTPEVAWWRGCLTCTTPVRSFLAEAPSFTGGVAVAAGDLNGEGIDEIITGAVVGGQVSIRIFDARTGRERLGFSIIDPTSPTVVYVAAGDLDGDGRDELVVGMADGSVRLFDGRGQPFPFGPRGESVIRLVTDPAFRGGMRVATGDITGDGRDDIIAVPGPGITPTVNAISFNFGTFAFQLDPSQVGPLGGAFVAGMYRDVLAREPIAIRSPLMEEEGIYYFLTPLPGTGGAVTMTSRSNLGTLSLDVTASTPSDPPVGVQFLPFNYQLGVTSQPTSPVTICLPYPAQSLNTSTNGQSVPLSPSSVRLYHRTPVGWEDITAADVSSGLGSDGGLAVCGRTTSFSPFAIGASTATYLPISMQGVSG
ncbi:MAG: hypothetical protein KatS3mg060_0130 [Dehalococcoidia bacterium]|nr:MAG: hypothetical protein KatS3mg060_0130 [Dehalococcoidia bacterium]